MTIVRHKKTGNLYVYLDDAIECTNGREDIVYALYTRLVGEKQLYCREKKEFLEKFEEDGGQSQV